MAIDPNAQYATANSYQTQGQSAVGQNFLANLGKYGQAGVNSWNANPQSFSVNDFNRIAQTNPAMATQMQAAGGQNYRNAIMNSNGWSNYQNNSYLNSNGSGALPGFAGYTGAGQGLPPGSVMGGLNPSNQGANYGQGYTGFGGTDLSVSGNPTYGNNASGGSTASGPTGSPTNPVGYNAGYGVMSNLRGVTGSTLPTVTAPVNTNPTTARRVSTQTPPGTPYVPPTPTPAPAPRTGFAPVTPINHTRAATQ